MAENGLDTGPLMHKDEVNAPGQAEIKVSEALEQEKNPGEPKILVKIFFSPHGTKNDIEGFREVFQHADVFIPERSGWNEETLNVFRKLSEGKLSPAQVGNGEGAFQGVEEELDRIVFNSHKLITFIDFPQGHPLDVEEDSVRVPALKFGPNSFNEMLVAIRNFFQKKAELKKKREEFMLDQLKPKVKELIDENPSLKEKKEINVAMILGSAHTSFFDLLANKGFEVEKTFNKSNSFKEPFYLELERKLVRDEVVSDEQMARVAFELGFLRAFGKSLRARFRDTQKADAAIATIVSQFSFDEIKSMFESTSKFDEFPAVFVPKIAQKGFRIPQSEREIDDLLATLTAPNDPKTNQLDDRT